MRGATRSVIATTIATGGDAALLGTGAFSRGGVVGAVTVVTLQQQLLRTPGDGSPSCCAFFTGQQQWVRTSPSWAHRYHAAACAAVGSRTTRARTMGMMRRTAFWQQYVCPPHSATDPS